MNDEVRDMIGKALDNEPPLGIDYDTVHAAGRRRLARRHVGIIGGAALAVVAAAGAAVAVGQLNAGPANGPAVPPTTSSTGTTPAPPAAEGCVVPAMRGGFSSMPDGKATDAELAESARLTEAFGGFALPLPPGVTMEPTKPRLCAVDASWGAEFTLRFPGGDRGVFLEVRPRAGQVPGECNTFGGQVKCAVKRRPDGSVIRISETLAPAPDQPKLVNVDAWRADDTLVRVMETGSIGPQPKPRILDDEALITIATAPELKVNWTPAPRQPAEPSDRRAAELTEVLARAAVLPNGMRPRKVPGERVDAMSFYVSQGGYKLGADLVDADGEGNLFININPPEPGRPKPPRLDCSNQAGCEPISLPDGRRATLTRHTDGEIVTLTLNATAADGTQMLIMSRNRSARSEEPRQGPGPGKSTRSLPPLGAEDLLRIASLPELRW